MNNDERTTMPTESVGESNKCSGNVCSPDRTTTENEHTFCTTSERPEKFLDKIRDTLYEILEDAYCGYVDSENTPGHEISERSDSSVQNTRLARTASMIHAKVNTLISMVDALDDRDNVILSLVRDNENVHKNTTAILERLDGIDDKIRTILSLAQSNNLMCYSIREHTKHAKDSLSILAENTAINKQAYGNLVTKLESLPDCNNCWANWVNVGSHKSERSEKLNKLFEMTPKQLPIWSLRNYKEVYEDSRLVHFWFYLKNYLYAPVQDILTDCAEYLFRWMHSEISAYCSEPTDDISEVQDITIYLDRMAAFYELVQAHKDDMSMDRYEAYMHIMSDIDILLSERSDSEVAKLGGDENDNTSG